MSISQKMTRRFYRQEYASEPLAKGSKTPAQEKAVKLFDMLPPLHKMPLWLSRPTFKMVDRLFSHDKVDLLRVVNHRVKLSDNQSEIVIREYQAHAPENSENKQPALMYFHGGGCVIGDINSHDRFCRYVAQKTGFLVFSVDYRLGPEHRFPTAIDDAILAWNWLCNSADELGVDLDLTGTGGDSAGAYLATLIAQLNISCSRPVQPNRMPAYQWLIYPMMDLRGESESYQRSTSGMLLTQDLMNFFRDNYLNNESERADPLASPLLCTNLKNMPPAYVLTTGHDPLMDSGISYAKKLEDEGNDVSHEHFEHQMHGFISFGGVCPYAMETINSAIDRLMQLNIKSRQART